MSIWSDIVSSVGGTDAIAANDWATGLNVFGQSMTAATQLRHGLDLQTAANYQAAQLRQLANSDMAQAERQGEYEKLRTDMVTSRQLALAAASGGGASDPTIVNLIARTAAEGAYRQASAIYSGEDAARLREMQAEGAEYQGKTAKVAGELNAVGGVVGGASTLFSGAARSNQMRKYGMLAKYGGTGPQLPDGMN